MLTGRDIAHGLGSLLLNVPIPAALERGFPRIVVDSREAGAGDLFVALPGERANGHQFIGDAMERGAAGVLAAQWPGAETPPPASNVAFFRVAEPLRALQTLGVAQRARFPIRTIAVTGSVGKTTTKRAIAGVLASGYRVLESAGNRNTEIGLPLTLLELHPAHQRLVLEMGMYAQGDIRLLCELAQPDVGVVTNIGPTHLERLGTMERIVDAKAELVESLPPEGGAVLNADDPRVSSMRPRTQARVVTYGVDSPADCRAQNIERYGLNGIGFTLCWEGRTVPVRTPLQGRHSAYTALAAATVALLDGMSLHEVAEALGSLEDAGRITVRSTPGGATLLDDSYNASPASMKAALDLLADMPGTRVAVLADMLELGECEGPGHQEVGRRAAETANVLFAIGPRSRLIAEAARDAGLVLVRHFDTKEEAYEPLKELSAADTFILLKGSRGMALDQLTTMLCVT